MHEDTTAYRNQTTASSIDPIFIHDTFKKYLSGGEGNPPWLRFSGLGIAGLLDSLILEFCILRGRHFIHSLVSPHLLTLASPPTKHGPLMSEDSALITSMLLSFIAFSGTNT